MRLFFRSAVYHIVSVVQFGKELWYFLRWILKIVVNC